MDINPDNIKTSSWAAAKPTQAGNSGWVRTPPNRSKERIERNPAIVQVAAVAIIRPAPEAKPISDHKASGYIGVHKSESLKSFIEVARNREEIREIIDQANRLSPGEKAISADEFERRLQEIKEKKEEAKEKAKVAADNYRNDPVILRFKRAFSDIRSDVVRIFADDNQELRHILSETAEVQSQKDQANEKLEQKQASKKEKMKERKKWDDRLLQTGITRPLRSFVLAPHRAPSSVAPL